VSPALLQAAAATAAAAGVAAAPCALSTSKACWKSIILCFMASML
jgi:hypothetical protein